MFLIKLVSKERNYFSIGKDYTNSISAIVHSDTLFSAICNNFRKLYGKESLEDFLTHINKDNLLQNEPTFKLSSCFHYIEINKQGKYFKTIYFTSRPLIEFPFDENSLKLLDLNPKILKRIRFISFELMRKLQNNETISFSKYHVIDGKYLVDDKDLENLGLIGLHEKRNKAIRKRISIFKVLEELKVNISRINQKSEPFTWPKFKFKTSNYYIDNDERVDYELIPGFFFVFDYSGLKQEILNKVLASIKLITDEGLGGKRSLGCGLVDSIKKFKIDKNFSYYEIFNAGSNGFFVNLSLVYPDAEDLKNIKYFNIYSRSGFIFSVETSSKRFNDIKFIEEGAIFDKKIRGKLIPVASEEFVSRHHEVYKNGIGFYLGLGKFKVN